jgi:hypothetical protein
MSRWERAVLVDGLRSAAETGLQVYRCGAGGCGSLDGDLDKFMDVLGAAPATAAALEIEFGLQLAGHDQPGASGLPDLRFGNSLAEAHVHWSAPYDDYEKHSQYMPRRPFCQPTGCGEARTSMLDDLPEKTIN